MSLTNHCSGQAAESGDPKIYVKTAEDGAKRAQAFCPNCGSPIYAGPEEDSSLQYVSM